MIIKTLRLPVITIGANIGELSFYSPTQICCNIFKTSEKWTAFFLNPKKGQKSQIKDYPFDLDGFGYPNKLPKDVMAGTFVNCRIQGLYETGLYFITYEGEGEVYVDNINTNVVSRSPGRIVIDKTVADDEGIFIGIKETKKGNHIKNISVIWNGHRGQGTFQPTFLENTKFPVLRFMDLGLTNEIHEPPIAEFRDLGKSKDRSWALGGGMPLITMIGLCNKQNADIWYCIPHQMSMRGIKLIAERIAQNLAPGKKAYIEYSNEWWNDKFPQNAYFHGSGKNRFTRLPEDSRFDDLFYLRRSLAVMATCREAFKANGREEDFKGVFPVHSAARGREQIMIDFLPKGKTLGDFFGCYAIAPYLGYTLGNGNPEIWPTVESWLSLPMDQQLDKVFEFLLDGQHVGKESSVADVIDMITYHSEIAKKHGLVLAAYEGGTHLVGVGDIPNNDKFNELVFAANEDPRIAQCIDAIFGHWQCVNAGVFCWFNAPVAGWTKWGPWSLRRNYNETNPKYEAVMRWKK